MASTLLSQHCQLGSAVPVAGQPQSRGRQCQSQRDRETQPPPAPDPRHHVASCSWCGYGGSPVGLRRSGGGEREKRGGKKNIKTVEGREEKVRGGGGWCGRDRGEEEREGHTCSIRNADVHFSIKSSEPTQSWVNAIGSVGGCHDYHVGPLLQSIHQSQQLRHDAPLHLSMSLQELL